MSELTFKEFLTALEEGSDYCDFIKDPQIKKACKKLMKKSPLNRTFGGFGLFGRGSSGGGRSPSGGHGSMTGGGTGGGGATGTGAGTGTAGTGGGGAGAGAGGGGAGGGGGA